MFSSFLAITLILVYLTVMFFLAMSAFIGLIEWGENAGTGQRKFTIINAMVAIFMVSALGALMLSGEDVEHRETLCARGHEEWHTYQQPSFIVGKVILPGGEGREKQWVCDEWSR